MAGPSLADWYRNILDHTPEANMAAPAKSGHATRVQTRVAETTRAARPESFGIEAGVNRVDQGIDKRQMGSIEAAISRVAGITTRVGTAGRNVQASADRLLSSQPECEDAGISDPPSGDAYMLHYVIDFLERRVGELESQVRRLEML